MEFDPSVVSFERLLELFWEMHNPGAAWRDDPDDQYRSAIFATTPEQLEIALASKAALEATGRYPRGISTEIQMADRFWMAEDYHQRYLEKRGVAACRLS